MIFDVATARQSAQQGRTEEWVRAYLTTPAWANLSLATIIECQQPLWVGPIEVELTQLVRCCGPEPTMRYRPTVEDWEERVTAIMDSLEDAAALPPLIVRPAHGVLGIPDGNHRHEAMLRKGWRTGWALLWCDREARFHGSWRSQPDTDSRPE